MLLKKINGILYLKTIKSKLEYKIFENGQARNNKKGQ